MSEVEVPKLAIDAHPGALIVAELPSQLVLWRGERAPLTIAAACGLSLGALGARQFQRDVRDLEKWSADPWPIAPDVDVRIYADVGVRRSLKAWANVLARAALLVLDAPLTERTKHVVKLAAVAAVSPIVLIALNDAVERDMRGTIERSNTAAACLNPDDAIGLRLPMGPLAQGTTLTAGVLAPLLSVTAPRSLPDGPLVDSFTIGPMAAPASTRPALSAATALFTGRCVLDAGSFTVEPGEDGWDRVRLLDGLAVLPPPNGAVVFLDGERDRVEARAARVA